MANEIKHAGPPIAVTKVSPLIGDAIPIKTGYVLSASSYGKLWLDNLRAQSSKIVGPSPPASFHRQAKSNDDLIGEVCKMRWRM